MSINSTLVIQSHCEPLPFPWLHTCINTVKQWAKQYQYEYLFIGDELFEFVSPELLEKVKPQKVIATDLARLIAINKHLDHYETVIWCDSDFLIFDAESFLLPNESYVLGREVWIQEDNHQLKSYIKVHNAFMMFRRGNSFLKFYIETAEKLLTLNTGTMPPQFIGPKLITALSNIAQCPIMETAGMLSPLVVKDIAKKSGAALNLFINKSPQPISAANLCTSLCQSGEITEKEIDICIEVLLNDKSILTSESK
ncbi:MAG: hypothetical protein AAGB35_10050 [Pseudomonadota bacterium]